MKIKTSINIDQELWSRAGAVAEAQDRSRSYIIEHIIEAGLAATEDANDFAEALRQFGEEFRRRSASIKKTHDGLKAKADAIKKKSIRLQRHSDNPS